jgi:hypothetical protein
MKLLLPPQHPERLERGMDFIQLLRTWGQKNQETNGHLNLMILL